MDLDKSPILEVYTIYIVEGIYPSRLEGKIYTAAGPTECVYSSVLTHDLSIKSYYTLFVLIYISSCKITEGGSFPANPSTSSHGRESHPMDDDVRFALHCGAHSSSKIRRTAPLKRGCSSNNKQLQRNIYKNLSGNQQQYCHNIPKT